MVYANMSLDTQSVLVLGEWIYIKELITILRELRTFIFHEDQSSIRVCLEKIKGENIVSRIKRFPEDGHYINLSSSYTTRIINNLYKFTNHRSNETDKVIEDHRTHFQWNCNEFIALATYKNILTEDRSKITNSDLAPQGFTRKTFEKYFDLLWEN